MDKELRVRAGGKSLTLDELRRFVLQAMRDGAAGDETPTVRTTFSTEIRSISVKITDAKVSS